MALGDRGKRAPGEGDAGISRGVLRGRGKHAGGGLVWEGGGLAKRNISDGTGTEKVLLKSGRGAGGGGKV